MLVDFIVDIFVSVGLPHLNTQKTTRTRFLKNLIKNIIILLKTQKKNKILNECKLAFLFSFLS